MNFLEKTFTKSVFLWWKMLILYWIFVLKHHFRNQYENHHFSPNKTIFELKNVVFCTKNYNFDTIFVKKNHKEK